MSYYRLFDRFLIFSCERVILIESLCSIDVQVQPTDSIWLDLTLEMSVVYRVLLATHYLHVCMLGTNSYCININLIRTLQTTKTFINIVGKQNVVEVLVRECKLG